MPRVISQSPATGCLTVEKLIADLHEALRLGLLRPEDPIYVVEQATHEYTEKVALQFDGEHLLFLEA
jgi:hypothetical protein